MMSTHIDVHSFIKRVDLRFAKCQWKIDHARVLRPKNWVFGQAFDNQSGVRHRRSCGLKEPRESSEIFAGAKGPSYGKEIVILRVEAYKTPNDLVIDIVIEAFSLDRMGNTKNMWMMLLDDAYTVFGTGPDFLDERQRALIRRREFGSFPHAIANNVLLAKRRETIINGRVVVWL